jgi:hypothetical protein
LGKRKNRRPETLEGQVLQAMGRKYTPRRAANLGFALIALGIAQMWYGVFPYYGFGLLFAFLGGFSASVGILDWLKVLDKEWLKKAMKQAAKDIWYGTT